jgi:hypothetical protein
MSDQLQVDFKDVGYVQLRGGWQWSSLVNACDRAGAAMGAILGKMKVGALAALALACVAGRADAAYVVFSGEPLPSQTFADGAFSQNLSGGVGPFGGIDGLYAVNGSGAVYGPSLSGANGYGQNGEFITFNHPVKLDSLYIGKCSFCMETHPATFTVNLYGAGANLVGSKTVVASSTQEKLKFDKGGVSKVEFTFAGDDGVDPYGSGRPHVAWYVVSNILYNTGVPEPAIWALMILGAGAAGLRLRWARRTRLVGRSARRDA